MGKEKFKVYEGVFDEHTLKTLEVLKRKKYFDSLGKPIKTGKEADVYYAYKGLEIRAIKIYRVTSANFNKIASYIARDFRFKSVKGNQRKVVMRWIEKEYRNLVLCHKSHVNVPYPYSVSNNCIIMEHIDGPMLKDIELQNPKDFLMEIIAQIKLMKNEAKLIHGDLSEFNILVRDNEPVIIDLGQAMSIKNEDDFKLGYEIYQRDVENITKYFNKRYKLEFELSKVLEELEN